jgi:ribonuclease HII
VPVRVTKKRAPTRSAEQELWAAGHEVVVGVDEVGRGAWAGPLMVGAAVLPKNRRVNGVRDSKLLTEPEREKLFDRVAGWCQAWAVGVASREECDELGMAPAQKLAARRAIEALGVEPDAAVVDGRWNFVGPVVPHVDRRVKADAFCLSVAAASILAKVTRDRFMHRADALHPGWEFRSHVGYSTPEHRDAIQRQGVSPLHRLSFQSTAYQQLAL